MLLIRGGSTAAIIFAVLTSATAYLASILWLRSVWWFALLLPPSVLALAALRTLIDEWKYPTVPNIHVLARIASHAASICGCNRWWAVGGLNYDALHAAASKATNGCTDFGESI